MSSELGIGCLKYVIKNTDCRQQYIEIGIAYAESFAKKRNALRVRYNVAVHGRNQTLFNHIVVYLKCYSTELFLKRPRAYLATAFVVNVSLGVGFKDTTKCQVSNILCSVYELHL